MSRSFASSSTQYLNRAALPVTAYPFAVSVSFRPNATALGKNSVLWSIGEAASNAASMILIRHTFSTGFISMEWGNPTFIGADAGTPGAVQDVWNHVLAICESTSAITFYLNGVKKRTSGFSGAAFGGTWDTVRIGRTVRLTVNTGDLWDGELAHVAVWDAILSDDEAAALNAGASPLMIRPVSLRSYVPHLGRDSPEIDIISATRYTVVNTPAASSEEPRQLWTPSRKYPRTYVVPPISSLVSKVINVLMGPIP